MKRKKSFSQNPVKRLLQVKSQRLSIIVIFQIIKCIFVLFGKVLVSACTTLEIEWNLQNGLLNKCSANERLLYRNCNAGTEMDIPRRQREARKKEIHDKVSIYSYKNVTQQEN